MPQRKLRQFWRSRMKSWLNRRIPPAHQQRLNMRSVFILPSAFGWLYLGLCACLFLLGTNYQNNVMLLLCFLLVALFLLNLHASYWNFARLHLGLSAIPPGYQGDHVYAKLHISEQHSLSPRFQGELSISEYGSNQCLTVDGQNSIDFQLPFLLACRGVRKLPRITLASLYPFGLYRCWTHIDFDRALIVYPRPIESELKLLTVNQNQNENEEGSLVAVNGSDDFAGLKSYTPGDSLNRISWKHVAKQQPWVSKSFESQTAVIGWLKLPMGNASELEIALSKLAFQINTCIRQNITFGLDLGIEKIQPSSGESHRKDCLLALAKYPHYGNSVDDV